jgi:hypothetical protein
MKFLKKYKVFESNEFDNIKLEIEDIFQEMKDEFKSNTVYTELPLKIKYSKRGDIDLISINIGNMFAKYDNYSLKMRNIKDTLFRVNDYMETEGYRFKSFCWDYDGNTKYSYTEFGKNRPFEDILKVGETVYLEIYYVKNYF